ncbi:MAG: M3 family metallopeptidase, partial [Clostridia bacterium]|nr:M3 family metallopeptidase [Clostridia bacterium]
MGNKKLKKRNEIDNAFKWKIEDMYSGDEAWNSDVEDVLAMTEDFNKYQGKLTESSSTLASALKDKDAIWQKLERAYVYAQMKLDEDRTLADSQARADKIGSVIARIEASLSFFTPEVLSAPAEKLVGFVDENPELEMYRFVLEDLIRRKEHILTDAEERLLAQISEVTDAPDSIFSMLNDADMKFGTIIDEEGQEVPLTHGNYISFMESADRKVREQAYTNMYESYKALINTISTGYNYNVKTDVIGARIRNYDSARDAALFDGDISGEVYDNLIDVVHQYLPVLHKYMELRKKVLGVED